jgi:ketosteroid isomerase-like protein
MPLDHTAFEKQVAPLMAELLASANALDADRHCALYARDPDLVFIANGEIIRGWEAYRARQREWWGQGRAAGGYAYRGIAYEALGEGVGLTTVVIAAQGRTPDGGVRQRELVFTGLWKRGAQGWRIAYAHESG